MAEAGTEMVAPDEDAAVAEAIRRVVVASSVPSLFLAEIRPVPPAVALVGNLKATPNASADYAVNLVTTAPFKVRLPVWPAAKPLPVTVIVAPGAACAGTVTVAVAVA